MGAPLAQQVVCSFLIEVERDWLCKPSCLWLFVLLVVIVGNRWIQQLHPVFEWRDCAARLIVPEEAAV